MARGGRGSIGGSGTVVAAIRAGISGGSAAGSKGQGSGNPRMISGGENEYGASNPKMSGAVDLSAVTVAASGMPTGRPTKGVVTHSAFLQLLNSDLGYASKYREAAGEGSRVVWDIVAEAFDAGASRGSAILAAKQATGRQRVTVGHDPESSQPSVPERRSEEGVDDEMMPEATDPARAGAVFGVKGLDPVEEADLALGQLFSAVSLGDAGLAG